jgi:hypothetical protein
MPPRRNRRGIAATSAKKSPIAPTKQPARVQKPPGNPISTRRRPAITTSPAEEEIQEEAEEEVTEVIGVNALDQEPLQFQSSPRPPSQTPRPITRSFIVEFKLLFEGMQLDLDSKVYHKFEDLDYGSIWYNQKRIATRYADSIHVSCHLVSTIASTGTKNGKNNHITLIKSPSFWEDVVEKIKLNQSIGSNSKIINTEVTAIYSRYKDGKEPTQLSQAATSLESPATKIEKADKTFSRVSFS